MHWIIQSSIGRCDFIDVLEEAVLRHRPTTLELDDSTRITAVVEDVTTRDGDDFVLLSTGQEISLGRIAGIDRVADTRS